MVLWSHPSQPPNDIAIASFFFMARLCDQHTDRHTDHATCDIYSNRPHLCSTCFTA